MEASRVMGIKSSYAALRVVGRTNRREGTEITVPIINYRNNVLTGSDYR